VQINVEVAGEGVTEEIGMLEGVRRVNQSHQEATGRVSMMLTADSARDVRPVIFDLAKSKGWTLFELHQETRSLEDLFQELTTTTESE
jgi:ABC-2 type transport system ATP-binding protein